MNFRKNMDTVTSNVVRLSQSTGTAWAARPDFPKPDTVTLLTKGEDGKVVYADNRPYTREAITQWYSAEASRSEVGQGVRQPTSLVHPLTHFQDNQGRTKAVEFLRESADYRVTYRDKSGFGTLHQERINLPRLAVEARGIYDVTPGSRGRVVFGKYGTGMPPTESERRTLPEATLLFSGQKSLSRKSVGYEVAEGTLGYRPRGFGAIRNASVSFSEVRDVGQQTEPVTVRRARSLDQIDAVSKAAFLERLGRYFNII
ncbi:MAG: hypothetical protein IT497_10350 [Ottowia sp.]|nr:hypothetical protein [Ottowia sp.]